MQKAVVILTHPVLGDCAQEVVRQRHSKGEILYKWKKKYGKAFYNCTVRVEGVDEIGEASKVPLIKNLFTEELYYSFQDALNETKLDRHTAYKQLNRLYKEGFNYLIKYV